MWDILYSFLQNNPIITLFIILGTGLLIGKIRVFGVELGSVTGVLFSGLVMGHLQFSIPGAAQSLGFILFIYCVGVEAGPQFFQAFKRDGLKYILLALVTAISGTTLAVTFAKIHQGQVS